MNEKDETHLDVFTPPFVQKDIDNGISKDCPISKLNDNIDLLSLILRI